MFINFLSFIKASTLEFLITDQTRSDTLRMFFFSKSTVHRVKRMVHFHVNSEATRWNYSNS